MSSSYRTETGEVGSASDGSAYTKHRVPYFAVGAGVLVGAHVILRLGLSGPIGTSLFTWAYAQLAMASTIVPANSWRWAPSIVWTIGYGVIAAALSVIGERGQRSNRSSWLRAGIGWVLIEAFLTIIAAGLYYVGVVKME